jgi:NAD(P)-dependent dehydrogenase (short-subunit alcohol dehydrogenase family)
MRITFENKVALVTGAASGLGLATAKAFAEAGASVVLADCSEKDVLAAAKKLADKGHKTLAVSCDVSDDAQVEAMVKKTMAAFGLTERTVGSHSEPTKAYRVIHI